MEFIIHPEYPYDFELSIKIFLSNGSTRKYENNKYKRLINVNEIPILIELESIGTVDHPELKLILKSNSEISKLNGNLALETVIKMFNLNFDLKSFYDDVKNEKILSKLVYNLYGLKSPATASVFEALVDAIVEQQISLRVAHSIEQKIIKKYGGTLNIDGHTYYAYPTPKQLNNAPFDELRACGLTLRKTEYIKSISKDIKEGKLDLEKYRQYYDGQKIMNELCKIRGIGRWTAEFVMIRGLNRQESLPADDIGIRRVISHYYCDDKRISSNEARKIAEKWGKWKGLAAYYLIIAEILDINISKEIN